MNNAWFRAAVAVAVVVLACSAPADEPSFAGFESSRVAGFTVAHRTASLGAGQTATIQTISAAEGLELRAGDVLVVFDDRVQQVRTALAKARAESTLEIELAQVRLRRAEIELQRLADLNQSVSPKELSDARTEHEGATLALAAARFNAAQAQRDHQLQRGLLEQLTLRAPFDGYVSGVQKQLGEIVEAGNPVLTLVQLHPLDVTIDCPLALAERLRAGDQALVQPTCGSYPARTGTITFINRVADAASQTVRVKLAVDNRDLGWLAGMNVQVDLAAMPPSAQTPSAGPSPAAPPRRGAASQE